MRKEISLGSHPSVSGILQTDVFLSSLPLVDGVTHASGGYANYVFALSTGKDRYFVKIRGDRFSRLPEIECNPDDIQNEYRALMIFKQAAPNLFPEVLSFNSAMHYMILSDAVCGGSLLEDDLVHSNLSAQGAYRLGESLREVHDAVAILPEDIRVDGDETFYELKLQHRFGLEAHAGLKSMLEKLKVEKRQLILGDPAPKNIGIGEDGKSIVFFDLEDAHRGNRIFDMGYLLGHILLQSLFTEVNAQLLCSEFLRGYNEANFDPDILRKIVLGTMRYRLIGKIPYDTPSIDQENKHKLRDRIDELLRSDLRDISWEDLLKALCE